jgi:ATP-binding cassette subfamily C protein CydCD
MFPDSRLLRLAQNSRGWLILTIILGFTAGLLTLAQAQAVSLIISQVFLEGKNLPDVSQLLIYTLVFFSLRALLAWISSQSAKTIAVQVKSRVRSLLLEKLQLLGPSYLEGEKSGELYRTAVEGVEALDAYYSQYLPQLVLSALVPLTILVFVFPRDPLSGLVLLLTAPLIPFFLYLIGSGAKSLTDRQYGTLSRLAANFLESLQGLTTLKLFNQAEAQVEKIRESSEEYRIATMGVLRVTFLSALALELLATLSTAVVAVEIGLRLLYFHLSLEQALFLLIIAPKFYIPLRLLGTRFHAGMEGQSAAGRIFEILEAVPSGMGTSLPPYPRTLSGPMQCLEMEGVSFTYPGTSQPAVQDINLVLRRGEQVALVGASGSGKSTLAKLILGFISPDRGRIKVDGIPLEEIDPASWRDQLAWVPQGPALFQDSLAGNIRLSRPQADDGAVAAAASAAHLAGWIKSLPEGYQTRIGEGGARLSGGQAQRLALARAFLKDASFLLLDEPTSQLDPATETRLADATARLMQGRTVLTIAHRLNTIFQADRILVLEKGYLVEEGAHQELMDRNGVYRKLVRAYTGVEALAPQDLDPGLAAEEVSSIEPAPEIQAFVEEENPQMPARSILARLLSFFRPYAGEVLLSSLLGFLTIASNISLMGTSAWLICMAALHPSIAVLQVAIVGVRLFGITRGVSRYFERLVSHNLTFKILTRLRVWFYQHLAPLAPARLLQYRLGDVLGRVISDIQTLENFYLRSLSPILVAALVGLASGAFLDGYGGQLSLVLALFFLLGGLALPLAVRFLARRPGEKLVQARAALYGELSDFIRGLPDLVICGQAGTIYRRLLVQEDRYHTAQLRLARISGLNGGLLILLSNLAMWFTLLLAIPLIRAGDFPGPLLAALALIVLSSFEALQPLPQAMEVLSSSLTAGGRLLEVVDAHPEVAEPLQPRPFPARPCLEFKDLWFSYPASPHPALEGISFRVEEGQILALVGPSGAGKTTLTQLLLRFWEGYGGTIRLGEKGIDLRDLSPDEIRRQISVVPQNAYLFNDSLRENIALGNPQAGEESIASAAGKARLQDLIQRLPDGDQTPLGEDGRRLSAGERQRALIARAVLKDAPIFLLDEPTANLDPLTEKAVLETLFGVLQGKTALLITHRLTGLERADRILVMDQGRIIEEGTEQELLSRSGFYRRMWSLQNRILNYG